ncbi:MAG: Ku protein [Firmicutes bacterium]|nr:Ku protein [Bacillota bacterium]
MRTIWKGAISFGLVHIPVKLYAATQENSLKFNYLHKECHTPIKYEKVCPACDRKVDKGEIVWGYEYEPGKYVVLEKEDFESIPLETTKTIDIIDFVSLAEIDPIYYANSYYLAPAEGGQKPYSLLLKAMQETGKIAMAKVVLRKKEALASLRVYQNQALVLETMFYPDEIRSLEQIPELDHEPKIHGNELKMAVSLIENLSEPFQPERYKDNYRLALIELVHSKIEGEEIAVPTAGQGRAEVIDLMTALEESIKATKEEKAQHEPVASK